MYQTKSRQICRLSSLLIFVLFLSTFIFSSCNQNPSRVGSVSFRVDNKMINVLAQKAGVNPASLKNQTYMSRNGLTEEERETLYFDIDIKGDYTDSVTIQIIEGATASFDNIPCGSEIWAEIYAYKKDSGKHFPFYTGKSEHLVVAEGENQLTVKMGKTSASISIYVKASSVVSVEETGVGTENNPFTKFESALEKINQINCAENDYTIFICGEYKGAISIQDSYDDNGTADDWSDDIVTPPAAATITISGKTGSSSDSLNGGFSAEKTGTVVSIDTSTPITVKKLKITGGYTDFSGGGIQVSSNLASTFVTFEDDVIIEGNYAGGYGGGIANLSQGGLTATVVLNGAIVRGNQASFGGGVYSGGKLFVCGSTVIGDKNASGIATKTDFSNKAFKTDNSISGKGGGLVAAGSVYIGYLDSTTVDPNFTGGIYHNYAETNGGGIYSQGTTNIAYCGIEKNAADQYGGGIANQGKLTIDDVQICNNKTDGAPDSDFTAYQYGGGGGLALIADGSYQHSFTMNGGIIFNNETKGDGGGICFSVSDGITYPAQINGGQIYENLATGLGGGLYVSSALTMLGGVVSANSASGIIPNEPSAVADCGKGAYCYADSSSLERLVMGRSARFALDNEIALGNSELHVIEDFDDEIEFVAAVKPGNMEDGTTVLNQSDTSSDVDLSDLYYKFKVYSTSSNYVITDDGVILASIGDMYRPRNIGDIVFTDGTAIAYATDLTLTQEQKDAAIAVIFYIGTECDDEEDEGRVRMLGVGLEERGSIAFETTDSKLYTSKATTGQFKNGTYGTAKIKNAISEKGETEDISSNIDYYPAFEYIKNYKSSLLSGTDYEDGWYMGTMCEHGKLFASRQIVNSAYYLCTGTNRTMEWYWSCDEIGSRDALIFHNTDGGPARVTAVQPQSIYGVCAIREF
ncbi:MAG: hypothetical protein K6G52_00945 [Treponemataceae bacterium]|nr:hypothetical protein [Treponemataceae bacterium]